MPQHPLEWASMIIFDASPVGGQRLASALRKEGYRGKIEVCAKRAQIQKTIGLPSPTLVLVSASVIPSASDLAGALKVWSGKTVKLVFREPGFEALVKSTATRGVDYAPNALDRSGQSSPQSIARQLLQLEPRKPTLHGSAPQAVTAQRKPEVVLGSDPVASKAPAAPVSKRITAIGLGASTGGVEALQVVLKDLPVGLPPIVIVQHTRNNDGASLVQVLNRATQIDVVKAEHNMPIMAGRAYVACGREQHLRLGRSNLLRLELTDAPSVSGHRPSVDVLFDSMSELGNQVAAVLMTGMGKDGAAGLKKIRNRRGWTAAQDEATSLVYGMAKAAVEYGAAEEQLALNVIAPRLVEICRS